MEIKLWSLLFDDNVWLEYSSNDKGKPKVELIKVTCASILSVYVMREAHHCKIYDLHNYRRSVILDEHKHATQGQNQNSNVSKKYGSWEKVVS